MAISHITCDSTAKRFYVHFGETPLPDDLAFTLLALEDLEGYIAWATIDEIEQEQVVAFRLMPSVDAGAALARIKKILQPRLPYTIRILRCVIAVTPCQSHTRMTPRVFYIEGLNPEMRTYNWLELKHRLEGQTCLTRLPPANPTQAFRADVLRSARSVCSELGAFVMGAAVEVVHVNLLCPRCRRYYN